MSANQSLLDAVGIKSDLYSGHNAETKILMLEIAIVELLKQLRPDFQVLEKSQDSINGDLVTANENDELIFILDTSGRGAVGRKIL